MGSFDREGRGWSIVIAEDDDEQALMIRRALENVAGRDVAIRRAEDGDEAVKLVSNAPPDLLLLDLRMPGRTGHEVLEALKSDERLRRVPIAVLTSSDREEDIARSYGLGGNHFITKPDDPVQLERKLRRLLENLDELEGIRRGARGIHASAVSMVSPGTIVGRRIVMWLAVLLIFGALGAFAYFAGIIP